MIVDFMLFCLNLGYQEENWQDKIVADVDSGKSDMDDGMIVALPSPPPQQAVVGCLAQ